MTLDTGAQTEVHVNRNLESQPSLLSLLAWTLGKHPLPYLGAVLTQKGAGV